MQTEPRISFRNIDPSPVIEDHIRRRIDELSRAHPRIIGCDVVVAAPQKAKKTGREFRIDLHIHVPGPDVHISRAYGRTRAADDVNLAIHRAFDAARRKLKEQQRVMSGHEVKTHPPVMHGKIDRMVEDGGYGFLRTEDGREVYFERQNLTGGRWEALEVGEKVRFREETGPKGAYATNVTPLG